MSRARARVDGRGISVEGGAWEAGASRTAAAALAKGPKAAGPGEAWRPAMEQAFGHDFRRVRVFADGQAAQTAAGLGARAVTADRDIFFGSGEYEADARSGHPLLAHELAHVVQHDAGAPALAFRDARDVRRVEGAIRRAIANLHGAARFLTTPAQQSLLTSLETVLRGYFPRGHGLIDAAGHVTQASIVDFVEMPLRSGGVSGTYRHEIRFFLSEEHPTEDARYQRTPAGGEIRIFVPNVLHMTNDELGETLTHELVHLMSDVHHLGWMAAHRLRSQGLLFSGRGLTQTQGGATTGTGTTTGGTTGRGAGTRGSTASLPHVSVSVSLADATLGHDTAFEAQQRALATAYRPVVDFINADRARRGAAPLDPAATTATWAGATSEELLAYGFDQRLSVPQQFAGQRGRARVAIGPPPFDPLHFFRVYASQHWLTDPADQALLHTAAAAPILRAAGRSPEMTAVVNAINTWLDQTTP